MDVARGPGNSFFKKKTLSCAWLVQPLVLPKDTKDAANAARTWDLFRQSNSFSLAEAVASLNAEVETDWDACLKSVPEWMGDDMREQGRMNFLQTNYYAMMARKLADPKVNAEANQRK